MRDTHAGLGHCGRDKLVDALQLNYWWPGLRSTTTEVLRSCPFCQRDKLPPPTREPPWQTNSTTAPGQGWSIDLAGPFPRDEHSNIYLAVAVDVHTKWIEAAPISSKHAFRTAEWFFKEIITCWGTPYFVRTDNSTKWSSEFTQVIAEYGIKHLKITVGNSKANG